MPMKSGKGSGQDDSFRDLFKVRTQTHFWTQNIPQLRDCRFVAHVSPTAVCLQGFETVVCIDKNN